MASSNEGDPPRKPPPKIIPQGPDDLIGIGAWLWRCDNPNPESDAPPIWPVLDKYAAELALRTNQETHHFMALFFHCYMTHVRGASYLQDRKHDRPTITRGCVELDEEEGGGRIDVQCRDDDVSIPFLCRCNLADEGNRLFMWLQDRHPDLSKELEAVIDRDRREDPQNSEDSAGDAHAGDVASVEATSNVMQSESNAPIIREDENTEYDTPPGEWSFQMTGAEAARRLTGKENARFRDIESSLKGTGFERIEGTNKVRIRLDTLSSEDRNKIQNPA